MTVTVEQARRFLLLKHGLLGDHSFIGKQGALDYIRQTGGIQFDPVDVCGRSADIALQARVRGYDKTQLDELLYKDRALFDFFDKNLCICPVEDWPLLLGKGQRLGGGYAEAYNRRGGEAVRKMEPLVRRLIAERGSVSAGDVKTDERIVWAWSALCSLPRATLESMYFRGELIVHHKTGTNKSYAFAKDYIPAEILRSAPPYADEAGRLALFVYRRIGAVGLLWNRPSDAWLGLSLKAQQRQNAFERLLSEEKITAVCVDDGKDAFYLHTADLPLLEKAVSDEKSRPRCELLAPLDCMMWDRKVIKALFGFDYSWEIYTPAAKRRYGAYVLPMLYGERFIGRVEGIADRKAKTLVVRNVWYEPDVRQTKMINKAVSDCLTRFAAFNDCQSVSAGEISQPRPESCTERS